MACVAAALCCTATTGLQEPTRWEWGPWVIQKAAGINGNGSKVIKPGAVFVCASRSTNIHAHTLAPTQSRLSVNFFSMRRPFFVSVRVSVFLRVSVSQCVRA
jgi:hypothetical protein